MASRLLRICVLVLASFAIFAHAQVLGIVRGIVHDPQHRPVANAVVVLKAAHSQFMESTRTNSNGEFAFTGIAVGDYTVQASASGLSVQPLAFTLLSDTSPVLHVQLAVAAQNETVAVTSTVAGAAAEPFTPTTLVDRQQIARTPGADLAESMNMITDFVPGAYMVHDMLHVRGGHQTSWLIDGVNLPNLNIGANLAPQIDPRDVDYTEALRGSYGAEYGDRTYGEFDVVPISGFSKNGEAELVTTVGNFYQTDDQLSLGDHTQRFAWYASLDGNRSNLGLETPISQVYHDADNGFGGFTNLIFNQDEHNQFRFDGQARRDYFQIPYDPDPNDDENQQFDTAGLRDSEAETDGFGIFTWVHTFNPNAVLTVAPFYHRNNAVYASPASDTPLATNYGLLSNYVGAQADLDLHQHDNVVETGLYTFVARENANYGLLFNDGSGLPPLAEQNEVTGKDFEGYAADTWSPYNWLSLTAGVRGVHFSDGSSVNVADPRLGASLRIPHTEWEVHGFWGKYYQPPPLISLSGPLVSYLAGISTPGNPTSFLPLQGESDEEHQFGLTIPWSGWTFDLDRFNMRANNFLDHNNIGESDIFIPVTIAEARVIGNEVTIRSPQLWHRAQAHAAYSNQIAEANGAFTGGLLIGLPPTPGWSLLDHDQRNTLNVGGNITLPRGFFAAANVYYGSGFSNGNPPPAHLPGHAQVDASLGKQFTDRISASLTALNLFNSHLLIDNSLTFGGFHWNNPFEVYGQVRYNFKLF